jgi:hypothetical protein
MTRVAVTFFALRTKEPLGFTVDNILGEASCRCLTNKAYSCTLDTIQDLFGIMLRLGRRIAGRRGIAIIGAR